MSELSHEEVEKTAARYRTELRKRYQEGKLNAEEVVRLKAIGFQFGRALIPGVNDLATTHPELVAEWHPIKNGDLKPCDVLPGSPKKAWWLGSCGHEWEAAINARAMGSGCPYCCNRKLLVGFNDLATTHPKLAAQWLPTKNGDLKPTEVTASSVNKIWWLGSCGHVWEARIKSRAEGRGCLYCAGRKVLVGFNDLATKCPDLAAEWHPTKNGDLKPEDVTYGSGKKVWWLGSCGHEWEAAINNRVKGYGCPYCSNRILMKGFNDLASVRPDLAAEWHPTKNGDLKSCDVLPGSPKKVWWLGSCGHEWEAAINRRAAGRGCLYCSSQKVLPGFNDLATKRPDLAAEWHPTKNGDLKPEDVTAGSSKKVWWKCKVCGHSWQAPPARRVVGAGCPVCAIGNRALKRNKAVVCIETGKIYESVSSAGLAYGKTRHGGGLCRALQDPRATAYGYHWRYADEPRKDV